jgi:hypothetical protein
MSGPRTPRDLTEALTATLDASRGILDEKSFGPADIPKHFYLVTEVFLPRVSWRGALVPGARQKSLKPQQAQRWKDLAKGQFDGIRGISGSGDIETVFYGVDEGNNLSIVMDGSKTVQANKLTRVMYTNPHYMLSRDMAALSRVFGGGPAFSSLMRYADKVFKTGSMFQLAYSFGPVTAALRIDGVKDASKAVLWRLRAFGDAEKTVSTKAQDLARAWAAEMAQDWNPATWLTFWTRVIEYIAATYDLEAEWVVKDRVLKIPAGSTLKFLLGSSGPASRTGGNAAVFEKELYEEQIDAYGLRGKYRIIYVEGGAWEKRANRRDKSLQKAQQSRMKKITSNPWEESVCSTLDEARSGARRDPEAQLTSWAVEAFKLFRGADPAQVAIDVAVTVGRQAQRLGVSETELSHWLQRAYGAVWVRQGPGALDPGAPLKTVWTWLLKGYRR